MPLCSSAPHSAHRRRAAKKKAIKLQKIKKNVKTPEAPEAPETPDKECSTCGKNHKQYIPCGHANKYLNIAELQRSREIFRETRDIEGFYCMRSLSEEDLKERDRLRDIMPDNVKVYDYRPFLRVPYHLWYEDIH
jgi:hypothetical protein